MRLKSLTCLCFAILLFSDCDDSFVVNADWKDITIIYGLLNANDSVNYIKINKAFLNENTNAIELAKIADSLYYKDSITVLLEEWNGPFLLRNIYLTKEYDTTKDSGVFAYPGQYLYKTPVTKLDINYQYKLLVKNPQTGKEMRSQTTLVGNIGNNLPVPNGQVTFKPDNQVDIRWYAGKNAYFYDLTIDVYYKEYPRTNPAAIVEKVIHWPIFAYRTTPNLNGGTQMSLKIQGSSFFDLLATNIPVDMNLDREFRRFEFTFSAGGEEIYNYINVNKPSIGIIQKKPEYSNIDNALGVFSSRNKNVFSAYLSSISITEIKKNAKTLNLNFQ
jgi:hypothetical protein